MFDFASPLRGEPVRMVIQESGSSGLSTATILRRLWKGSGFIVLSGLFMVASAVGLLGMLTPAYTSGIQVFIDPNDLKSVNDELISRPNQADAGVSLAESQTRVIQSDSVLRRVIEKLGLNQDEEFTKPDSANPMVALLKSALGMVPPPASRDPTNIALDTLRTKLTVRRPERTFVIDVSVQSQDPQKAADIANGIGDAYFAEEAAARTDAARRVSDSLGAQLDRLRQDVENSEEKVVRYRETNRLTTASGRLLSDQQLGDLNQQLVSASIRSAESKAKNEQARVMKAGDASTALPEMLQSLEMQSLRQQYATLSRNTAELATRLGARHPAMAEQYAQQRDLQRLIQREKERIIETTQKDYDRAVLSEAAIRRNLEHVKQEMNVHDRANVGLRELERTVEARRNVYESFLRRWREIEEQKKLNNTNVRIISSASPARLRSWPPSPKIVLPIALLLGLLLGSGIALALGAGREKRHARTAGRQSMDAARSLRAADA